jgi:hypothetical protein
MASLVLPNSTTITNLYKLVLLYLGVLGSFFAPVAVVNAEEGILQVLLVLGLLAEKRSDLSKCVDGTTELKTSRPLYYKNFTIVNLRS